MPAIRKHRINRKMKLTILKHKLNSMKPIKLMKILKNKSTKTGSIKTKIIIYYLFIYLILLLLLLLFYFKTWIYQRRMK